MDWFYDLIVSGVRSRSDRPSVTPLYGGLESARLAVRGPLTLNGAVAKRRMHERGPALDQNVQQCREYQSRKPRYVGADALGQRSAPYTPLM
jgi:hypothetical protein